MVMMLHLVSHERISAAVEHTDALSLWEYRGPAKGVACAENGKKKKRLQDHQSFFRILFKITAMTQNYSSQCSSLHESFGHRPKVSKSQEEC